MLAESDKQDFARALSLMQIIYMTVETNIREVCDMKQESTLKIERERKFLVEARLLPDNFVENIHFEIRQYYLTKPGDSVEIRIRSLVSRIDSKYFLTIKRKVEGGDKSERYEEEVPITNPIFYQILRLNGYKRGMKGIVKERFLIKQKSGIVIEVDVYDYDPKSSLMDKNIVAEIELKSKSDFADLELPPWIGEEVTGRPEYSNAEIAEKGFPKRK